MSEQSFSRGNRFQYDDFALDQGPVTLFIASMPIQVIKAGRDLPPLVALGFNQEVEYLIIDPETFDPHKNTGYKGIRHGETIELGRNSTYGRFDFDDKVSREHVRLERSHNTLHVWDRGSTNGTRYGAIILDAIRTVDEEDTAEALSTVQIEGSSLASERHPDHNDDQFFFNEHDRTLGVFDGVGGVRGSEMASRIAAHICEQKLKLYPDKLPIGLSTIAMKETLQSAHQAILNEAQGNGVLTTAIISKLFRDLDNNPYAMIATIGDSRAYLLRDGKLSFLTMDNGFTLSTAPEEIHQLQDTLAHATSLSQLTNAEALAFRNRNIIDGALGQKISPTIATSYINLIAGDKLLLTSDGIHDNLTHDEIATLLRENPGNYSQALTNAAQVRSRQRHIRAKPDDMTAVVLSFNG